MDSTDPASRLSPVVRAAARGQLPRWAEATEGRREHIARVAALLSDWAEALGLDETDRARWTAAGTLHDALRDAPPERLRQEVPERFRSFPGSLLHGPAAAERLEGEADPALLDAIRYHTVGHPDLDTLGRAVYLADFLEPGREFRAEWRAELRRRMPREMDDVLREVAAARIRKLLERREPIRPETAAFWSGLVSD